MVVMAVVVMVQLLLLVQHTLQQGPQIRVEEEAVAQVTMDREQQVVQV
jgi:hypothetical protein